MIASQHARREDDAMVVRGRSFVGALVGVTLAVASMVGARPTSAVEVGQAAPDFKLASTTGVDISLADFRGKKWVLLEFYGHDFVPT
jgi:AhpC/TSA family